MMKTPRWFPLLVVAVLACSNAQAAAPTFMPLQGLLTDAAGEPIEGAVTLNFSLYDQAAAMAPIWTETQTLELTRGQLVSYLGLVFPLQPTLFADHHQLWLD